ARPTRRPSFNEIFASLAETRPLISAPETVPAAIMFNERFAASAPQGVEPTKLADASPAVEKPKAAEAPRLVEAVKPK
ncbi:hypothetical protein WFJ45_22945, partial [Salmonella enterica subsp. enterica serovar Minnesota]|uniref:hypothetical protein n=1 Tax=Salmonella enterica TaxID=28901 RepID=UPI003D2BD3E3